MKKRIQALLCAIVISGAMLLGLGACLKYLLLAPMGLGEGESPIALPFLLLADAGLRRAVKDAMAPAPTTPPTTFPPKTVPPTVPETTPPATEPTTVPTTVPTEPPEPTEAQPVGDEWFADVLFLGDSRTCGLREYARIEGADYFCTVGMTVFDVYEQKASDNGFDRTTLEGLLAEKTYGKILIGLGINELGYPADSLWKSYTGLVDFVREKQPGAVIILQSIMTVSREKAADTSYYHLENIYGFNEKIASLADNEKIFYIDANEAFADEEGYLPGEITGDGCHLYAKYYEEWSEWIRYAVAQLGV